MIQYIVSIVVELRINFIIILFYHVLMIHFFFVNDVQRATRDDACKYQKIAANLLNEIFFHFIFKNVYRSRFANDSSHELWFIT